MANSIALLKHEKKQREQKLCREYINHLVSACLKSQSDKFKSASLSHFCQHKRRVVRVYNRRQSADQTTLDNDFVCEIVLLNKKYKNLFHIFKLSLISDN